MKNLFLNWPLYPLLLAAYPPVALYLFNPADATVLAATTALLVCLLLAAILWGGINLWLRNPARSALITTVVLILFFSYGHIHAYFTGAIHGTALADYTWQWHLVLSLFWLLILRLVWLGIRRWQESTLTEITPLMNATALVFLALPFITSPPWGGPERIQAHEIIEQAPEEAATHALGYAPDIYLIVLDGYARGDYLETHYDFDNSPFLDSLQDKGFFIAEQSQANYYWTFLSFFSSLNMQHITWLSEEMGEDSRERGPVYDGIRDNKVARFLADNGYEIVHFNSTWGATRNNPYADREIQCSSLIFHEEFYRVLWETTWLRIFDDGASFDLAQCWLSHMEQLAKMGQEPGPKFVFAHFMPPHHPYLFDREGNILRHATISNQFQFQENLWEDHDAYIEQLRFLNRAFLEIIEQVLETSDNPPVILLQSDHGPHLKRASRGRNHTLRMANLMAMHLPGTPEGLVSDDITLVNQFPLILNHYFGTDFEIQSDTLYYSEYHTPYLFQEIKTD